MCSRTTALNREWKGNFKMITLDSLIIPADNL